MKNKTSKMKSRAFFAQQGLHESLDNLVTRIELIEGLVEDVENTYRIYGKENIHRILEGYLDSKDFDYIKEQKEEIARRKNAKKAFQELEREYVQTIIEKVIPEDEVRKIVEELSGIMSGLEDNMIRLVERKFIPALFIDSKNNPLEYRVTHKHEVRCNSCGDVSTYTESLGIVLRDRDFFKLIEEEQIESECSNKRCISPEDTSYISAANLYEVKDKRASKYAVEIGTRVKSSGRMVDKLIDIISGGKSKGYTIADVVAIRIVAADEENAKNVRARLTDVAKELGVNLRGRVDYKNFQRESYKSKPEHSAIHIDFVVPPGTFLGNLEYDAFEIQIQDELGVTQDLKQKGLQHQRYVEKQENQRREKWRPIHFALREYLTPLFAKLDYADFALARKN
ncbi:hypothetical protein ACFLTH_04750 [Bacteroidota bacterium]